MKFLFQLLLMTAVLLPQSKVEDVKSFTLTNGMKIFVLEDHSIPNANMYLFYKVGSRNEFPGITGLSHFFEHMMFNGAEKYGPKMFDRTMEAAGGANNAYTTENNTVYTNWFPKTALETIFDLESDRIANLNFNDKMIESERGVILSERSTWLENSNYTFLAEQVNGAAFLAHPYRWPVIGFESDIKNWKKTDLQEYYNTYYAPGNCVVVVSGDVDFENVKLLAEKYFGKIAPGKSPREVHTVEPEQLGEKRIFVNKSVSSPNIMITYHVPETGSNDYYALNLLNSVLTSGRTSRLFKLLIDEKQLATEVTSDLPLSFDPTLLTIYAVAAQGKKAHELEEVILTELNNIAENGVSENELLKVKNQKLMEFYRAMETIDGKSNNIGNYELFFGDYKKMFNAPEEFMKVTADQIKSAAAKYFRKSNRTVGILSAEEEQL